MKTIYWAIGCLTVLAIVVMLASLMTIEWAWDHGEDIPAQVYLLQVAVGGWFWLLWRMRKARRVLFRYFEGDEDIS